MPEPVPTGKACEDGRAEKVMQTWVDKPIEWTRLSDLVSLLFAGSIAKIDTPRVRVENALGLDIGIRH